jgi:putative DNA primase/helicase
VDDAARRRFCIVPFLHKPEVVDPQLEVKLEAEWPAILRWLIDGCRAWQTDGLPKPDVVKAATDEYFRAQDAFGQWQDERCIRDPSLAERPSRLLADYNIWAQQNGEAEATRSRFRSWAERQTGLRYKTVHGSDYLQGLGLKAAPHA